MAISSIAGGVNRELIERGRAMTVLIRRLALLAATLLAWLGPISPGVGRADQGSEPLAGAAATFGAAWNILNSTHWDTNFNGLDWAKVRDSLLPQAQAARSVGELRGVLDLMLQKLGDSQCGIIPGETATPAIALTNLLATSGDIGDIGLELRGIDEEQVVSRVLPNWPAAKAGIKPGWILQEIGGEAVKNLGSLPVTRDQRLRRLIAWTIATQRLQGEPGSMVSLTLRDEKNREIHLACRRVEGFGEPAKLGFTPMLYEQVEKAHHGVGPGVRVGVIRFNIWTPSLRESLDQALEEMRKDDGLILDLRGNPGGLATMASGVAGRFFDNMVPLGEMRVRQGPVSLATLPQRFKPSGELVPTFQGPLAILVDDHSLGASEIFAAGMQRLERARVFGQTTPGYALPAAEEVLPNGDRLVHAVASFRDPTGKRWEQAGVIPDEIIPLNRTDLLTGKDATLSAAETWITRQIHSGKGQSLSRKSNRQANEGRPIAAAPPAPKPGEPGLPSAEEIITRFVQAIGGTNALGRHQSAVIRSKVMLKAFKWEGQIEAFHARPNKSRSRLSLEVLTTEQGYDGAIGWSLGGFGGPTLVTGKTLDQMVDEADFEAMMHPARIYRSMRVAGKVQFEGQECYHLILVSITGREWSEFFAIGTGLLAGTVLPVESQTSPTPATTVLSDYKDFGGLLFPSKMTAKLNDLDIVMLVESIEYDTVSEEVFALPPPIQALMSRGE